ncbi:MAG: DUF4129 domain-containing protein [Myxococcota bacterium]
MRALLVLSFLLTTASAAAQPPDPREVARSVHAEQGYAEGLDLRRADGSFSSFPSGGFGGDGPEGERVRPTGGRSDGVGGRLDGRSPRESANAPARGTSFGGAFAFLGDLLAFLSEILLVLVVVGLVVLLVVLVVRTFRAPPGEAPAARELAPADTPELAGLPAEVGDPDELARSGRFEEAIVACLVRALKHVGWQPERQRGLTAREVALSVHDARRGPLQEVVTAAERVRFAGVPADRESYDAVRRWYDALLGLAAGAPA